MMEAGGAAALWGLGGEEVASALMRRTTIQLDPDMAEYVREEAHRCRISQSELIRRALSVYRYPGLPRSGDFAIALRAEDQEFPRMFLALDGGKPVEDPGVLREMLLSGRGALIEIRVARWEETSRPETCEVQGAAFELFTACIEWIEAWGDCLCPRCQSLTIGGRCPLHPEGDEDLGGGGGGDVSPARS